MVLITVLKIILKVYRFSAGLKYQTIDYCNNSGLETFGIPSQVFNLTVLHDEPGGWPFGGASYRWPGSLFTYKTGLINWLSSESAPYFENVYVYPEHIGYFVSAPLYGLSQKVWHLPFDNLDGPYPIMFDLKGFSGWFDSIGGSACEALVCEEGGVVGGVFKGTSLNPLYQLSDLNRCDREFYDALFGERIPTLGAAFYDALVDTGAPLYDLNLFGDPALKVKGTKNHRPTAVINCSTRKNGIGQIHSNDTILPGTSLIFNASGSYDVDGRIESYSWDFSNGFVCSNVTLRYVFDQVGVYVVRLNVTDNNGDIGYSKFIINVVDPSNNQSVISLESPVDGTADVSVDVGMVSVKIEDYEDDCFDWTISFNPDVGFNSGVEASSGFKTCTLSNSLEYNTTYTWTVSAMDYGSGITTESVFSFTTVVDPNGDDGGGGDIPDPLFNLPPEISLICPSDGSEDVSVNLSSLEVNIVDPEGDCFDWSIQTSPDVGSCSVFDDSNGTKTCSISGLQYYTTYEWIVTATDLGSSITVEETFVFTTEVNNTNDEEEEDEDGSDDESSDDNISVEIVKPIDGGLYVFNELKRESFSTVIIGDIDIIASVIGENTTRISSVNFYIDNQLLDSIDFNSSISEYKYVLDGKYIGMFTLKVEAVNSEEIILASDSVDCFIFNFGLI